MILIRVTPGVSIFSCLSTVLDKNRQQHNVNHCFSSLPQAFPTPATKRPTTTKRRIDAFVAQTLLSLQPADRQKPITLRSDRRDVRHKNGAKYKQIKKKSRSSLGVVEPVQHGKVVLVVELHVDWLQGLHVQHVVACQKKSRHDTNQHRAEREYRSTAQRGWTGSAWRMDAGGGP